MKKPTFQLQGDLYKALQEYIKENYADQSSTIRQALANWGPLRPYIRKREGEIEDAPIGDSARISVSMPDHLYDALQDYIEASFTDQSSVIRQALANWGPIKEKLSRDK